MHLCSKFLVFEYFSRPNANYRVTVIKGEPPKEMLARIAAAKADNRFKVLEEGQAVAEN